MPKRVWCAQKLSGAAPTSASQMASVAFPSTIMSRRHVNDFAEVTDNSSKYQSLRRMIILPPTFHEKTIA
jgi:hypothetical protein